MGEANFYYFTCLKIVTLKLKMKSASNILRSLSWRQQHPNNCIAEFLSNTARAAPSVGVTHTSQFAGRCSLSHSSAASSSSNFSPLKLSSVGGFMAEAPRRLASTTSGLGQKAALKEEPEPLKPLYLDAQATSPLDPRVLDTMMPYWISYYGNPHSRTHQYGWDTEKATETARAQVASLIGADPREIIFTSGATESNNISVKGVARFYKSRKKHVITSQIEHKCVLDSCRALEMEGFRVTYLPVNVQGQISLEELEANLSEDTSLVSIMTVNNEIGVVQPVEEIGRMCRAKKVFFHTDAAQAVGKMPMNVDDMKIDLMSISGHKIYGPKGVVHSPKTASEDRTHSVRRRPRKRNEEWNRPYSTGGWSRGCVRSVFT